jgi:hypothetical protein
MTHAVLTNGQVVSAQNALRIPQQVVYTGDYNACLRHSKEMTLAAVS